jgi:hypothetical protein
VRFISGAQQMSFLPCIFIGRMPNKNARQRSCLPCPIKNARQRSFLPCVSSTAHDKVFFSPYTLRINQMSLFLKYLDVRFDSGARQTHVFAASPPTPTHTTVPAPYPPSPPPVPTGPHRSPPLHLTDPHLALSTLARHPTLISRSLSNPPLRPAPRSLLTRSTRSPDGRISRYPNGRDGPSSWQRRQ